METHDPNVYPTFLGGVLRGFWTPFLDRGARSAIFWHVKTGTFGHKQNQKKGVFRDTLLHIDYSDGPDEPDESYLVRKVIQW